MRQILTYKLFDGTKMVYICDCADKTTAMAYAIEWSKRIFSNKKFIISKKSELVDYEKWSKNNKVKTSVNGSHNFSVALITKDRSMIDNVSADGIKTAYNLVKQITNLNYEPMMFLYDLSQVGKLRGVYERAQFTLADKQKTDKLLDEFTEFIKKLPISGKVTGPLIADLITWKMMLVDVRNGAYNKVPIASILKIACVIIYFVSPVNTSFEAVPVVGQIDDIMLIKMIHDAIKKDVENYEKWRRQNQIGCVEKKQA